jgi:putative adhesin
MDVASGNETVMRKRTNKIKPEEGMNRLKVLQIGILALLVAVALFGLFGCDIEEIIEAASGNVSANREITQVYEIAGLLDLTVESSNGYVIVQSADSTTMSIVPGDTANVTVKAFLRSRADTLEKAQERVNAIVVEMIQTGDNLLLRYNSADQSLEVRKYSGVSFEVTVPAQADVEVDTSNGAITIRGIEGQFNLDTSNGAIDLIDLSGVVAADTSNGAIDVDGFTGALNLETSNGAIDIEDVEAAVNARTSNGRIDFSGILVGGSHSLRTSNGAINVEVPLDANITFDASTSIGSISTNLQLMGDTEGRSWNASMNSHSVQSSQTLELHTSNGNIRIEGF